MDIFITPLRVLRASNSRALRSPNVNGRFKRSAKGKVYTNMEQYIVRQVPPNLRFPKLRFSREVPSRCTALYAAVPNFQLNPTGMGQPLHPQQDFSSRESENTSRLLCAWIGFGSPQGFSKFRSQMIRSLIEYLDRLSSDGPLVDNCGTESSAIPSRCVAQSYCLTRTSVATPQPTTSVG